MNKKSFDEWYAERFGERWHELRRCLLEEAKPVEYKSGLEKPYFMDHASVLAAESLRLPESGTILDACAAPGGKSLVIASRMSADCRLICNEVSAARRRRLSLVLDDHLDEEKRKHIKVSGFDAASLGGNKKEWNCYDAILIDAPCSSERHVIQSKKALSQWTPARPRFLAGRQWALLSAAFLLLKSGCSLVYSTCSLCDEENDEVVSRLMEKYGENAIQDPPDFVEGEKTRYGKIILPDVSGGIGPMYVARIKKSG